MSERMRRLGEWQDFRAVEALIYAESYRSKAYGYIR